MERIEIEGEYSKLVGVIHFPDNPPSKVKLLVGVTGKGGPKERFNEIGVALAKQEIVTVAFDFSGRGESKTVSTPATSQQIDDLRRLLEYLKVRFDDAEITIVATSMGALSACMLSREFDVAKLVLVAPTIIPDEMLEYPFTEVQGDEIASKPMEELRSSKMIKEYSKFEGSVVLVQLTKDTAIPDSFFDIYKDSGKSFTNMEFCKIMCSHGILHDDEGRPKLISLLGKICNNAL